MQDEARAIFLQVVSAVLYAHRLHMLYRELLVDCIPYLKPENIYLSFSKMTTTHVLAPVSSMTAKVIYSFLLSIFFSSSLVLSFLFYIRWPQKKESQESNLTQQWYHLHQLQLRVKKSSLTLQHPALLAPLTTNQQRYQPEELTHRSTSGIDLFRL